MRTKPLPRRRADVAEAEGASSALEVVHAPLPAHFVAPRPQQGLGAATSRADHRPPARAAAPTASLADGPLAAAARAPRSSTALPARPRLASHAHNSGVTAASGKFTDGSRRRGAGDAVQPRSKNVDDKRGGRLPSSGRGKKQSPRRSVGLPKPRASGASRSSNSVKPSWLGTDAQLLASFNPPENRYALLRATESLEPSMAARNQSKTTLTHQQHLSQSRSPAHYAQRKQNQGLCDSVSEESREVTEAKLTERLSALRHTAQAIVETVDRLEALLIHARGAL